MPYPAASYYNTDFEPFFKRHTRVRFENRKHTHYDWLGVAIVISAAFLAANFIFYQQNIYRSSFQFAEIVNQNNFDAFKSNFESNR